MADLNRKSSVKDVLKIKPCPMCGGSIKVSDCGYNTFNPGAAECEGCGETWKLGLVDDQWDAGLVWNRMQSTAKRRRELEKELEELE